MLRTPGPGCVIPAAKDRTFKTVRPNQGTTTEASEPRIGVRRPIPGATAKRTSVAH
jgi:hypothetical protein